MEKMVSINSARLKYAREYYGLNIDTVSVDTKLPTEKISAFENGNDYPTYSQLDKLANYYNQPVLFFFFPSPPPPKYKLKGAFRSLEQNTDGILSKRARELIEIAYIYKLNLSELFEGQDAPSFHEMLKHDQITSKNDVKALVVWLRKKLELPLDKQINAFSKSEKLLDYLRERFYNIGIYIFKEAFRENSISGLCLYDETFPVILLNNKTTFGRQLFTLFHELYHIFLQKSDLDSMMPWEETECSQFASEFLIPTDDFNVRISNIRVFDDDAVLQLAARYCVSMGAIKYRLIKAQRLPPDSYEYTPENDMRSFNAQSSGGNYYNTKISYLGQTYLKQVLSQYYTGRISIATVGLYTQSRTANVAKLASALTGGAF